MTSTQVLTGIKLDNLTLMELADGLDVIVTEVTGWYSTPDIETHDVDRILADGALFGPKIVRAREIVISGWALGTRDKLMLFQAQLAMKVIAPTPVQLQIYDPWIDRALCMAVRGSGPMSYEAVGNTAFRYQMTFRSSDPRRYDTSWEDAEISLAGGRASGRVYQRSYQWSYPGKLPAGTALLTNPGSMPAPVQILYTGPLSESRLTDGANTLRVAAVADGVQILIASDSLVAQTPNGNNRASYVLANSQPLLLPSARTVTWSLLASGSGSIKLSYRGAYA